LDIFKLRPDTATILNSRKLEELVWKQNLYFHSIKSRY
jgi:hypothetical protein